MAVGLNKGSLSNTVGSIFTATTPSEVKTIILFNENTTPELIQIYFVNNDGGNIGTATARDMVFSKSLTSGETFELSPAYPIKLESANDSIQASAITLNKVNFIILGRENV